jgi:SCY1-like protein 2
MTPSPFTSPSLGSTGTRPSTAQQSAPPSRLKARPVPTSTFNSTMFNSSTASSSKSSSTFPSPAQSSQSTFAPLQPTTSSQFAPMQPTAYRPTSTPAPMMAQSASGAGAGPNYNISLTPSAPSPRPPQISVMPPSQAQSRPPVPPTVQSRPPPGYSSGLMQPTVATKPGIPTVNGKVDWGDFDPLG